MTFRAYERHDDDVGPLLVTIQRRIEALLHRRGVPDGRESCDVPDRWTEDAPALAGLAAAFDLHAGIAVPAGHRDRLERLCGYALRPPVGQDRLQLMPDGTVVLELRRRWTDGTTHLVFDPEESRINLILYHGVLAPRAAWRRAVVPAREDARGR